MSAPSRTRAPRRVLWTLLVLLIALFAGIGATAKFGTGQWSPKLGLDLEGGTRMVLEPVLADPNAAVSAGQLEKARDIIAQRVDSNGVAEAEITTQSGRNIVISIPGQPDAKTLDQIRKPSQLRFRAVLVVGPGVPASAATPTATSTGTASSTPTPSTPAPIFTMDPAGAPPQQASTPTTR